jgi:NADH dehydrogenase FAD-containing subunit
MVHREARRDMGRLVLIGAGHAHLHGIARLGAIAGRGHEVTVIAPGPFWYSGLATGMLGGRYEPREDCIDVAGLVHLAGGRFVADEATRIDPTRRVVSTRSGLEVPYDVLSLDVGSRPRTGGVPGLEEFGLPVAPVGNLALLRAELEGRLNPTEIDPLRVLVVGGGPSGCEVAANVVALAERRGGRIAVTLLGRGPRLLPGLPAGAGRAMERALARRGIAVRTGEALARVEPGVAVCDPGETIPFNLLVTATGPEPPPLARASGLPTDADGALRVDRHLSCPAFPEVLGGGDAVAFAGRRLPRAGVHAVRQAPVLLHNWRARLEGRPPRAYHPQRRSLLILNLGDGTGLATWGPLHYRGRPALWLKDRIDRAFLARYHARTAPTAVP